MHSNRLLEELVEEHSSGARSSAIKSEGKFVQVGLQVICTERSLVCAEQPPFRESRHAVDTGEDFVRVHARAFDGGASMNVIIPRCGRVGGPSVSENPGARFYVSEEEGAQRISFSIGDNVHATATESFWLKLLYSHSHEDLTGRTSPTLSRASTAQHRFIHFHIPGKSGSFGVTNGTTKSVQHCPSGLVGAKPHEAVKRLCRNPIFRRGHVPCRSEPNGEGRFRAMEDCAGRRRNPATALFAPPSTVAHAPSRTARAVGTGKSVWPAQPIQIIETSGIIRKPAKEFSVVLGVVLPRLRPESRSRRRHPGMLASPHSSGYPTNQITERMMH